jgi:hypothetical protein
VTNGSRSRFERVRFLDEAIEDLRLLATRSRPVLVAVFGILKQLDDGSVVPTPLRDYGKTGDLTDCGKLVVAVDGEPEHRIVVRDVDGGFTVSEVIAVDERTGDLPYLLAALRLGRIEDPGRRSEAARRIHRLRTMRER